MTFHSSVTPTIRPLHPEEIYTIYTTHSVRHFPDSERKPLASIQRMIAEGIYSGYGLFSYDQFSHAQNYPSNLGHDNPCSHAVPEQTVLSDNNEHLMGYAFCTMPPCCNHILLDYFAILEEHRSIGTGSLFLQQLNALLRTSKNGILIESEDPDYSSDTEETTQRWRRIAFYEKNHAVDTGIRAQVFDVPYRVLCLPFASMPSLKTAMTDFQQIYQHMVSPEQFVKHIKIHT